MNKKVIWIGSAVVLGLIGRHLVAGSPPWKRDEQQNWQLTFPTGDLRVIGTYPTWDACFAAQGGIAQSNVSDTAFQWCMPVATTRAEMQEYAQSKMDAWHQDELQREHQTTAQARRLALVQQQQAIFAQEEINRLLQEQNDILRSRPVR